MGVSRVACGLLCIHAVATTPVQPIGPRRSCRPIDGSLPCSPRRSAWTLVFSRRAQRSLRLRPGCSPTSFRGLYIKDFNGFVTATAAPIATGWSDRCRVGLTPTEDRRLVTAYETSGLTAVFVGQPFVSLFILSGAEFDDFPQVERETCQAVFTARRGISALVKPTRAGVLSCAHVMH